MPTTSRAHREHAPRAPVAPRGPSNEDAAHALEELALRYAMDEVPFKARAFERAAESVASSERAVTELIAEGGPDALRTIPGVGEGIAERLVELARTGHIADLDGLRRKHPADVVSLCAVEGIGPKTVAELERSLGVKSLADLRAALEAGRVAGVPGFGAKKQARLRASLALWESEQLRTPLPVAREAAAMVLSALRGARGVIAAEVAGSIRRGRETIGDLDFVVAAEADNDAPEVMATLPMVERVLARGDTKVLVHLASGGPKGHGIDADLRVVSPESFGAALLYFTGSKAHNIALRGIAQRAGLKLNEYGLFRGERALAARTEADVYAALGLDLVPPELREDRGEIDLALHHRLPMLVRAEDVTSDVHVHLPAARATLEAARAAGLETIVITALAPSDLRAHARAVHALPKDLGVRALAGAEVEIRVDGTLATPDDVLAQLDFVGGGVHTALELDRAAMTARIVRALESGKLDVLHHPLARVLGRHTPIDVDYAAVLAAAKRTGTALEIDAHPDRLDLDSDHVHAAIDAGVRIAIGSGATEPRELRLVREIGVTVARRGWARASDLFRLEGTGTTERKERRR